MMFLQPFLKDAKEKTAPVEKKVNKFQRLFLHLTPPISLAYPKGII